MVEASVLVVGGGAIGGVTAARMTGHVRRVTVLDANAEHVARLNEPGLIYEQEDVEHTVRVDAVTEVDGDYDFALVAVKSPHHRAALEPLIGRIGAFVTLGNGLIQDRVAEIVGRDRLLACLVEWAGTNAGPGRLIRDTVGAMVAGELDGEVRERTELLARCLETVGEARISRNIRGQIWSKLLVNTTFTGLSAVSGLRYGGVAERCPEAVFGLWREGLAVAEHEGVRLERILDIEPPELAGQRKQAALERVMAQAGRAKPSMLQDLEAGRITEVDVVNGGMAAKGREHGVPTPLNDRVVALVHAMERGERSPDPEALSEVVRPGS